MSATYNNEKILVSFTTHRKLDRTSLGANMLVGSLLGHSKTSGVAPDLYTLYLTEKTFYAEYSRKSLHGSMPKKVTKLDIPIEDIVEICIKDKDKEKHLYIRTDWGKEYMFNIESKTNECLAEEMIGYIQKNK